MTSRGQAAVRQKGDNQLERYIAALLKSIEALEKSCGRKDYSKLHKEYRRDKDGVVRAHWVSNEQKANGQDKGKGQGEAENATKPKGKPRRGPLPILSKEELHAFIEKHKTSKIDERVSLGSISNEARERIKAAARVDVERVILDSGSIRHVFSKPGHNLDSNDLDDMKEIIETTRDIVLSPKKNKEGNPVIIFRKEEPNGLFLCEEYRAKKKELELQTAYRIKKNRQPHGAVKQPPTNVRNVTAPNENVSQSNGPVNRKPKKISKSKPWIWTDGNGKLWIRKSVMETWRQGMARWA